MFFAKIFNMLKAFLLKKTQVFFKLFNPSQFSKSSKNTLGRAVLKIPRFLKVFKPYFKKIFAFVKKYKTFLFIFGLAFLLSDLLLIKSYNWLLPEKKLPALSLAHSKRPEKKSLDFYKNIWENNIFHTGPIPSQLKEEVISKDPVLSSLPFKLRGTIVHANPSRSVATIRSTTKTVSYKNGDLIENQAEVRQILRTKVLFFNQNNNRMEYILLPKEKKPLNISYKDKKKPKRLSKSSRVKREGNNFKVTRANINKELQRLPEILQQARVVPYRSKRGGEIEGFKFSSIDKGSVFEELGFVKGDIIKEVNGETVTTPEKALELFDRLKGESSVKLLVKKDGKDVYYEYNVNENAPIR